eukprot:7141292-Prymnesium_polylepis.1
MSRQWYPECVTSSKRRHHAAQRLTPESTRVPGRCPTYRPFPRSGAALAMLRSSCSLPVLASPGARPAQALGYCPAACRSMAPSVPRHRRLVPPSTMLDDSMGEGAGAAQQQRVRAVFTEGTPPP